VVQMTRKHVAIEGNRSDERANNFRWKSELVWCLLEAAFWGCHQFSVSKGLSLLDLANNRASQFLVQPIHTCVGWLWNCWLRVAPKPPRLLAGGAPSSAPKYRCHWCILWCRISVKKYLPWLLAQSLEIASLPSVHVHIKIYQKAW
jgi:hypothetical protein